MEKSPSKKVGSSLTVTKNENIGSAEVKLGASAAWVFDSSAAYNGDVNTFDNKITLDQGNATLSNIGDGVVEIAGAIDGGGSLVKGGAGDMKITGNNTYTGATIVNDGKLVVNGNISTSQLTEVNDGAALGGAGAGAGWLTGGGGVTVGAQAASSMRLDKATPAKAGRRRRGREWHLSPRVETIMITPAIIRTSNDGEA